MITLTPNAYSAEDYRTTYWLNSQYIVQQLGQKTKPLLLFVSSTSVYGQSDGEWVDESSPQSRPPRLHSGYWQQNRRSPTRLPVLHPSPSGIYGPGRDYLIRQVLQGNGGGEQFTNRIHSLDLARLLAFLLQRFSCGAPLPPYVLASDDLPVPSHHLRAWLAELLAVTKLRPSQEPTSRGGNKRISNQLLHQLGLNCAIPPTKKATPSSVDRQN